MFKLYQPHYTKTLDEYKNLEQTLIDEKEKQISIISQVQGRWKGQAAETFTALYQEFLTKGEYFRAQFINSREIEIMDGELGNINRLMARCEQLGRQLQQDEYVAPVLPADGDDTIYNDGYLTMDYDYIPYVNAAIDNALQSADEGRDILLEAAEICSEVMDMSEYTSMIHRADRKIHRLENYRRAFNEYADGVQELENRMSSRFQALKNEYEEMKDGKWELLAVELDTTDNIKTKIPDVIQKIVEKIFEISNSFPQNEDGSYNFGLSNYKKIIQNLTDAEDSEKISKLTESLLNKEAGRWTEEEIYFMGQAYCYGLTHGDSGIQEMILSTMAVYEDGTPVKDFTEYEKFGLSTKCDRVFHVDEDMYNAIISCYTDTQSEEYLSLFHIAYNSDKSKVYQYVSGLETLNGSYSNEKLLSMQYVAVILLNQGFEPEFVAGILGNMNSEGEIGSLEKSNYSDEQLAQKNRFGEYTYQYILDLNGLDGFDYLNDCSGKNIQTVGIDLVEAISNALLEKESKNLFGLGCIQWTTHDRNPLLIEKYREVCGENNYPTLEQCMMAEGNMIICELSNEQSAYYTSVYKEWQKLYKNEEPLTSVINAGILVCTRYEVCSGCYTEPVQDKRCHDSVEIYNIMMQTNYNYDRIHY